jgi:hypothetical protein
MLSFALLCCIEHSNGDDLIHCIHVVQPLIWIAIYIKPPMVTLNSVNNRSPPSRRCSSLPTPSPRPRWSGRSANPSRAKTQDGAGRSRPGIAPAVGSSLRPLRRERLSGGRAAW